MLQTSSQLVLQFPQPINLTSTAHLIYSKLMPALEIHGARDGSSSCTCSDITSAMAMKRQAAQAARKLVRLVAVAGEAGGGSSLGTPHTIKL